MNFAIIILWFSSKIRCEEVAPAVPFLRWTCTFVNIEIHGELLLFSVFAFSFWHEQIHTHYNAFALQHRDIRKPVQPCVMSTMAMITISSQQFLNNFCLFDKIYKSFRIAITRNSRCRICLCYAMWKGRQCGVLVFACIIIDQLY